MMTISMSDFPQRTLHAVEFPDAKPFILHRGYVQVILTGVICFCCPGFFNALQGLGGAGNANPSANSAANVALYGTFTLFGYFGGMFFNVFGPRTLMAVGGTTYAAYAFAAYVNGRHEGYGWLFIASGALLGFGAGLLWTAQGALMMAYAPMHRKGHYIGLFWLIFNLGGFIGGLAQFAINYKDNDDESSKPASPASYFTFCGVMLLGATIAAFGLVNPENVVREDGEKVKLPKARSATEELRDVAVAILDKRMLLLALFFMGSNFFYTYVFNCVNAPLFSIRTRGLNSALFWVCQMVGAMGLGRVVDNAKWSLGRRARVGFWVMATLCNLEYAFGAYLQFGYEEHGYERDRGLAGGQIDVVDSPARWAYPAFCIVMYGVGESLVQAYAYWIMGALAGADTALAARYTGVYKGLQSLGAAVAWLINIQDFQVSYGVQYMLCWVTFVLALPTTYLVVRELQGLDSDFSNTRSARGSDANELEAGRAGPEQQPSQEKTSASSAAGVTETCPRLSLDSGSAAARDDVCTSHSTPAVRSIPDHRSESCVPSIPGDAAPTTPRSIEYDC